MNHLAMRTAVLLVLLVWAGIVHAGPAKVKYPGGKCYMYRLYLKDKSGCG
jgi:hypothetical protein